MKTLHEKSKSTKLETSILDGDDPDECMVRAERYASVNLLIENESWHSYERPKNNNSVPTGIGLKVVQKLGRE